METDNFCASEKSDKIYRNILLFLQNKTQDYENRIALGIRNAHGWNEFTYKGIGELSRKIGCYLIKNIGVIKGERLAILSESRPEFGAGVFASILAGMITVPLDIKLTKYELKSILEDCTPSVIVVSGQFLQTAKELLKEVESIKHIICLDDTEEADIASINALPRDYEAKWRHRSSNSLISLFIPRGQQVQLKVWKYLSTICLPS